MQQEVEKYIVEGRFAMARTLIVTLPPERRAAWHAAIDILNYAKEDPQKALALDAHSGMLTDAAVRKAFKLRSVLVHPDKLSSCIAESAFRQLSLAYEETLRIVQASSAGGKPSTNLSSETAPEQFAWWQPWDAHDTPTHATGTANRRCSCAADATGSHHSDDPQAQSRHLDGEAEPSSGGPDTGAPQLPTSHQNIPVHLSAQGASVAQQPNCSAEPSSDPNKRVREDESEMVADAAADLVWLNGMTLVDLAVEVKHRKDYLMNALASRKPARARTAMPDAEAEVRLETECAPANKCSPRSRSIGGVSIDDLGLEELRAALDRSRSCLASRTQKERKVGAALGGFF